MNRAGFTLIELLAVMAVSAILLGMGYQSLVRQQAVRDLSLAAAAMQQAVAQAQGEARRGTASTLTVTEQELKVGTKSYPLSGAKITGIGASSLNFIPPYGAIELQTGQKTPLTYTVTATRRPGVTLKVNVTSIFGKVITK